MKKKLSNPILIIIGLIQAIMKKKKLKKILNSIIPMLIIKKRAKVRIIRAKRKMRKKTKIKMMEVI